MQKTYLHESVLRLTVYFAVKIGQYYSYAIGGLWTFIAGHGLIRPHRILPK